MGRFQGRFREGLGPVISKWNRSMWLQSRAAGDDPLPPSSIMFNPDVANEYFPISLFPYFPVSLVCKISFAFFIRSFCHSCLPQKITKLSPSVTVDCQLKYLGYDEIHCHCHPANLHRDRSRRPDYLVASAHSIRLDFSELYPVPRHELFLYRHVIASPCLFGSIHLIII